jgi:hypothetical protein
LTNYTGSIIYNNFTQNLSVTMINVTSSVTLNQGANNLEVCARDSLTGSPKIIDYMTLDMTQTSNTDADIQYNYTGVIIKRSIYVVNKTGDIQKKATKHLNVSEQWDTEGRHIKTSISFDKFDDKSDYVEIKYACIQGCANMTYLNDRGEDRIVDDGMNLQFRYYDAVQAGWNVIYNQKTNGNVIVKIKSPDAAYYNALPSYVTIDPIAGGLNRICENYTIFYDPNAPTANLTSPTNGIYTQNTTINFTYFVNDSLANNNYSSGIQNTTLYIRNSTNSIINQTTTQGGFLSSIYQSIVGIPVTLTDGFYSWFADVFDLAGSKGTSQTNNLTIDTTSPTIAYGNGTQNSGVNLSRTNIYVNVTVNETNEKNITFLLYDTNAVCYQESSNTSNQTGIDGSCGLSYTGNYYYDDYWENPSALYDGDWGTSTNQNKTYNLNANYYVNYTKPFNATYGSYLKISYAFTLLNYTYTIPSSCLNPTVQLKVHTSCNDLSCLSASEEIYCYDSTNWTLIDTKYGLGNNVIAEEAMVWNIIVNKTTLGAGNRTINWTGLPNNQYWYNVTVCDQVDFCTSTSTRTISLDTVNPIIYDISPLTLTYFNITSYNIVYAVNDSIGGIFSVNMNSSTVYIYNNATQLQVDSTTTPIATVNNVVINTSEVQTDGVYFWNVTATDYANNIGSNATKQYFTIDTTYPQITYGSLTLASGINISRSNVYVDILVTETNENYTIFSLYNTNQVVVNQTTYPAGVRNINWTGLSDGKYYYNVTVCDKARNCNSTATRNIVLDINSPTVVLNDPGNNSVIVNSPILNYTVNDTTSGVLNSTYYVFNNLNGSLVAQGNPTISNIYQSTIAIPISLTEGFYKWFANAFDYAGNYFATSNNSFVVNYQLTALTWVNQTLPAGGYPYDAIWVNLSSSHLVQNLTINITSDTGYTNQVIFNNINTTQSNLYYNFTGLVTQGTYTVTGWSYDYAARRTDASTLSYLIDNQPPVINITDPTLPSGTTSPNNYIELNFTVYDTNLANVTAYLYNSNNVLINRTTYYANGNYYLKYKNLDEGIYYYNITAYATVFGQYSNSSTYSISLEYAMINVSICRELNSNTIYNVIANLYSNSTCLNVTSPGVTIDCNGYIVSGQWAILITKTGATLNNCYVVSTNSSKAALEVKGNSPASVSIYNSTFTGGLYGIYVAPEASVSANLINVIGNTYGVYFDNSNNGNNIASSTFSGNTEDSITLINTDNNYFSGLSVISSGDASNDGSIVLYKSANNMFTNSNFTTSASKIFGFNDYSINNVLYSSYYDSAKEAIDGTSQLIRQWGFSVLVVDSVQNKMQNAIVTWVSQNIDKTVFNHPENCYQEQANGASPTDTTGSICGLTYNGLYEMDGSTWSSLSNDGDWTTYGALIDDLYYINYSKPMPNSGDVLTGTLNIGLVVANNTDPTNHTHTNISISVPGNCFTNDPNQFRINQTTINLTQTKSIDCYVDNVTNWTNIYSTSMNISLYSQNIGEESMNWSVQGTNISYTNLTGSISTISDGTGVGSIIQYMNIFGTIYNANAQSSKATYNPFTPASETLNPVDNTYQKYTLSQEIASSSLSRTAWWIILGIVYLIGIAASVGFFMVRMREGYSVVDIWKYFIILVIWFVIFTILFYLLATFLMAVAYPKVL